MSPRVQGGRPGPLGGAAQHLALAMRETQPARARLEMIYGSIPPSVYFVQRAPDGPIKIGYAQRLVGRMAQFYRECPDPVIVRAVVPGGRALESWFHRRHRDEHRQGEWYDDADDVVLDARRFGDLQATVFAASVDRGIATVAAISEMDVFLGDFYRLYRNGATQVELARIAGLTIGQTRARLDKLRALGFHVPNRRVYGSRTPSKYDELPISRGGARLIG